jgi:hypothetical protein
MSLNLQTLCEGFCAKASDPAFSRTLEVSAQPQQTPKLGL